MLYRVKVWGNGTPPGSPELPAFNVIPYGTDPVNDPDGIATGGAPMLDIVIEPVSGVDVFTVLCWGSGSTGWEVFETITQDYDDNPSRRRLRRSIGSGVRFVALQAGPAPSFDGDDNTTIRLEPTYG